MSLLHFTVVVAHVLAAIVWIGGILFLALVGAPVLRRIDSASLRARLFTELGRRFRVVGWGAVLVLLVTGTLNLHFWGFLRPGVMGSRDFWASPIGISLAWKLGGVGVMLLLSAGHDLLLGPMAANASPGTERADRVRRIGSWFARATAVAALIVVVAAVRLARGG